MKIEDLVAFRVPFQLQMSALKDLSAEEILDRVLTAPIEHNWKDRPSREPAKEYINATSILLTKILERATSETLPNLAEQYFFKPLKMHHTTFFPTKLDHVNIAPTEIDPWRNRVIQGEVHDESAWKLQQLFTPGSAGLFSTATDLIEFARMLLLASSGEEENIFSATDVREMSEGLGWETQSDWLKGTPPGTFGKTGFTGCHIAISPQTRKAVILLSNSTWPHRSHRNPALLKQLRQSINVSIL
ncbi:beta-lactamase family protein [Candidatus Woesebacteria bacterium]|nr:beta-lactamase family protein [Candidatus Woesebacteria bacterium]